MSPKSLHASAHPVIVDQSLAARIAHAIEHTRHFLPAQSPLQFFVHHNTLHSFEQLRFKEAVLKASALYGTEPFLTEAAYHIALRDGRITAKDCEEALKEEPSAEAVMHTAKAITCSDYRVWRLTHPIALPAPENLKWWMQERQPLTLNQQRLWHVFAAAPDALEVRPQAPRYDALEALVHPVLIRLAGAYLDQGVAMSAMPQRGLGFLAAIRAYYREGDLLLEPWLHGIAARCERDAAAQRSAMEVIEECVQKTLFADPDIEAYVETRLLSLRGWAGMFNQFEEHPEKCPIQKIPATLLDFFAVQLMLEEQAREYLGSQPVAAPSLESTEALHALRRYETVMVADGLGLSASDFATAEAIATFRDEINAFGDIERRYSYHLAFERHYRQQILDSLLAHQELEKTRRATAAKPNATLQIVCCMDEREESFRRHLEETSSEITTFGFAGFFGVAMYYQGIDDVETRALCPVVVTPRHTVKEVAVNPQEAAAYLKARQRRGKAMNLLRLSRKTLLLGTAWSLLAWAIKPLPLIGRSVFPRPLHRLVHGLAMLGLEHPLTRLDLSAYTLEEQRDVVKNILGSMGLTSDFAPLVMVVGHGSASLNNPHLAAYNCGATGGGCGNANARAFAAMANNPQVRRLLAESGIVIPESTWFLGGYHNTTSESMAFYDTDLMPFAFAPALRQAQEWLEEACNRDAHERTRRFAHTPHPHHHHTARRHAEQHAMDWAEARPEYGHSTNAACMIGRREKTKNLFLDRRCFLISYDPQQDPDGAIAAGILRTAGPVGAGINLEYYFSAVDPLGYGCGTKLPHNITGLMGVMDGASSDLRTGLTLQMVEIHEPMRLLVMVEATPERLLKIAAEYPVVGELVVNEWIQLISWDPVTGQFQRFHRGTFVPHQRDHTAFPIVNASRLHYSGKRHHLNPVHVHSDA